MDQELAELVHPSQAALLVIDVQNDFCHINGVQERSGINRELIRAVVPQLKHFIQVAEAAKLPILYVRNLNDDWSVSPTWRRRNRVYVTPMCQRGTWGAEFYEVLPRPEDAIIEKFRYSAFADTNLALYLRSRGVQTIILVGCATNVCVESTARDGFMRDLGVVVVEDCCAARALEDHLQALHNVRRFFGVVASSAEIQQAWEDSGVLQPTGAGR